MSNTEQHQIQFLRSFQLALFLTLEGFSLYFGGNKARPQDFVCQHGVEEKNTPDDKNASVLFRRFHRNWGTNYEPRRITIRARKVSSSHHNTEPKTART